MEERLHQNQSYDRRQHVWVERELGDVREEVRSSAQTLAAIGENLIVALRQFDSRLTESSNRSLELAQRVFAGEQQLSELKSAVQTIQRGLEHNCQVIAEFIALLERMGRQVANHVEEFSNFRKDVQSMLLQQSINYSDGFTAVQSSQAAAERRVDSLAEVISLHTQEHADISSSLRSLSMSIAALQATSEQTCQRVQGLEKLRTQVEPKLEVVPVV